MQKIQDVIKWTVTTGGIAGMIVFSSAFFAWFIVQVLVVLTSFSA